MQDSFDLTGAVLPKQFSLGCLTFRNGHLWRLSHFVWDVTTAFAGATFFGDLKTPWNDRNLFRVEIYRLPKGLKASSEQLEWYSKDRKSRAIKIADGPLFDKSMLHVNAFGNEWDADSFAPSKEEIIRIYRSQQYAIFFDFLHGRELFSTIQFSNVWRRIFQLTHNAGRNKHLRLLRKVSETRLKTVHCQWTRWMS